MSPIIIFLLSMGLQQGMYELSHKGFRFDKPDALIFTTVLIGATVAMEAAMDIPNGPNFGSQALGRAKYAFMGQAASIGLTLAIPGL